MTGRAERTPMLNLRGVPAYLLTCALGGAFALGLYPIWKLEGRWFFIVVAALVMISASLLFIGRFTQLLLIVLLFAIPLAGFSKWPFLDDYPEMVKSAAPVGGALGLGLNDFVLLGLFVVWGLRVVVAREEPWPHAEKMDAWVLLLLLSCAFSLWGADDLYLGFGALEHLLKHALVYLVISRLFRREHLPWLLGAIAFAVVLEASVGLVQNRLGLLLGLILDKGAGGELLDYQEEVPGIEDLDRATGLSYDPHALGAYLAMLVPYCAVFIHSPTLTPRQRLLSAGLLGLSLVTLVITYSRSAWLSGGISLAVVMFVMFVRRERGIYPTLLISAIGVVLCAPMLARIFERLWNAPKELVQGRFEQFPVAWDIWREHFLFGNGAGNYMDAMYKANLNWAYDYPVHNVPLFIAADTGLFGLLAYIALAVATLRALSQVMRRGQEPIRRFALAGFAGLLAYYFDGMSDPLFRESTVYMMFWVTVGLSVALQRMVREEQAA